MFGILTKTEFPFCNFPSLSYLSKGIAKTTLDRTDVVPYSFKSNIVEPL